MLKILCEYWTKDGYHSSNRSFYDLNIKEKYLHRDGDFPALIIYNPCGKLEEYFINGKAHRDGDFPAKISYVGYNTEDKPYKIVSEEYWKDGKKHRENGPAIIYDFININLAPDSNLKRISHEFYQNGVLHNEKGPAKVKYDKLEICEENMLKGVSYYLNGKIYNKKVREFSKEQNIPANFAYWTDADMAMFKLKYQK